MIDMGKGYSRIAVIYGCDSSEWEVSCRSGEFVASRIDGSRYDVYEIFARFGNWTLAAYRRRNSMRVIIPENERPQVDKTDFSVMVEGEKVRFDYGSGYTKAAAAHSCPQCRSTSFHARIIFGISTV